MRLIRLGDQPTGVTADIRAALTAIGRGDAMVGGVAVLGVPTPEGHPVDAVVLTPHAALVVGAVALPEPALHLEAPLNGQWRADGWRVTTDDGAVNPATTALERCARFATRIREHHPTGVAAPVGTVIAVGPYVEHVEQPATELTGSTRVLHPTTTSMLSAAVSMPRRQEPLTTSEVSTFLGTFAPDATHPGNEALLREGFAPSEPSPQESRPTDSHLSSVESTVPAPAPVARTTPAEGTSPGTTPQQFGNPTPHPASTTPPVTVLPPPGTEPDQCARPAAATPSTAPV